MSTFAHPQVGEKGLLREKKTINYTVSKFCFFMGYSHKTLLYVINVPLKVKSLFCVETIQCLMEKAMAPHSSILAWKIPWTEESGWLQSMRSRRVRHD